MTHDYIIDFNDYKAAQRLYFKRSRGPRLRLWFWLYLLPGLTGVVVVIDLWVWVTGNHRTATSLLPVVIYFGVISLLSIGLRPWKMRRSFKQLIPPGQKDVIPVQFSFGDEGIRSAITGRSEGRFFWSALPRFEEDDTIALIFISKKKFVFVSKRAMDSADWDDLRARMSAQTGKA